MEVIFQKMKSNLIEEFINDTFNINVWKIEYVNNHLVKLIDKNYNFIKIIDVGYKDMLEIYLNDNYYQTVKKVFICFKRHWQIVNTK